MFNKVKTYFLRVVFFSTIVMIGIMLTGAIKRDYVVLERNTQITIGEKAYDLDGFAQEYLPKIVVPDGLKKEGLDQILYEVVSNDSLYTINYYFKWHGEQHPDPAQYVLSNVWKLIYFKFNLSDIEFLQVDIRKLSGVIDAIKFANGSPSISTEKSTFHIGGWAHNFKIGNRLAMASEKYLLQSTPVYFEESAYKSLKIARRSQGDYKTNDNKTNIPIILFLALTTTYYFRHMQKDYEPKDIQS